MKFCLNDKSFSRHYVVNIPVLTTIVIHCKIFLQPFLKYISFAAASTLDASVVPKVVN